MTRVVIGLPKVYFDLSPHHGLSVRLVRVERTSFNLLNLFLVYQLCSNQACEFRKRLRVQFFLGLVVFRNSLES
jgi:hypothetical protein